MTRRRLLGVRRALVFSITLVCETRGFVPCSSPNSDCYARMVISTCHSLSTSGSEEHFRQEKMDDVEEDVDVDAVSEAEALLACRSYLQRRNRLRQWTKFEQRKVRRELASEKPHYFWENPSELMYFQDGRSLQMADPSSNSEPWNREMVLGQQSPDSNDDFSSLQTKPSEDHIRRSRASKRVWDDPTWKAKWYERRWGEKSSRRTAKQRSSRQKRLEEKVRALPPGLLGSAELASLSEDEIAQAITTYIKANQKRVDARLKTQTARKEALNATQLDNSRLARDSLFRDDPHVLQEAQRKRSERAAKAYQTRLRNNPKLAKSTRKNTTKRIDYVPTGSSPKDALIRIELALNRHKLPHIKDIEILAKPVKLGKRRAVFRRILEQCFGMRGKCVPVDIDDINGPKNFVTTCSISDLSDFVLFSIREENKRRCAIQEGQKD